MTSRAVGLCACLVPWLLMGHGRAAADEDPAALRKTLIEAWARQDRLDLQYHVGDKGGESPGVEVRLHKIARKIALRMKSLDPDEPYSLRCLFGDSCSVMDSGETSMVALGLTSHARRWAALEAATRSLAQEWHLAPPDPWPARGVALTLGLSPEPDGTVRVSAALSEQTEPVPSWLEEDAWREAEVRSDAQGVVHVDRDGSRMLIERSTGILVEQVARRAADGTWLRLHRVAVEDDGGNFQMWMDAQGPQDALAVNQDFETRMRVAHLVRPLTWLLARSRVGALDRERLKTGIAKIVAVAFDDACGRAMVRGLVLHSWPPTSTEASEASFLEEAIAHAHATDFAKRWWTLGECLRSMYADGGAKLAKAMVDEPWALLDEVGWHYLGEALQRGFVIERTRREVLAAFRGLRRQVREYTWTTQGVQEDPWRGARVGLYVDEGRVAGRIAAPVGKTSEFSLGPERARYVVPDGSELVTSGTRYGHERAVRLREICSRIRYPDSPNEVADIPEGAMSPVLGIAPSEGRPTPQLGLAPTARGVPDWLDPATWTRLPVELGDGPELVLHGEGVELRIERATGLPTLITLQMPGGPSGRLESVPARETAFDWRSRLASPTLPAANEAGRRASGAAVRAQFQGAATWICRSRGGAAPTPALRQAAKDIVEAAFSDELLGYMVSLAMEELQAELHENKDVPDAAFVVDRATKWATGIADEFMSGLEPEVSNSIVERTGVVHDSEMFRLLTSELRDRLRRTMEAAMWRRIAGTAGGEK